jgi:hypothetical protein
MIEKLKLIWKNQPLWVILSLALILRLTAAIFSKGYSMSDDHFLVIHIAQRWLDGFSDWLNLEEPKGHSIVYPGLHYLLFYFLKQIGITDPQFKMFIVRLIHATYSLLIVVYGYKLTLKLADLKSARQVGMILALFWILPFMSVRNLIEMVCIPPLMIGYYLIVLGDLNKKDNNYFYAGLIFGISFIFRYQSLIIPAGIVLVLLTQKSWRHVIRFVSGISLSLFLIQGIVDWIAWGYPFAAFYQYVAFNLAHRFEYVVGPWYQYLILILGVFIPPVSFYLIFGFAKTWKKLAVLFWPVLLFFLFHSYFPNKQERFVLPILPFILLLGVIGWQVFISRSNFWNKRIKLLRASWAWFWMINLIMLLVLTFTYPKKTRVEPLIYLSQKEDLSGIIIEYNKENMPWFPRFYLSKQVPIYRFNIEKSTTQFREEVLSANKAYPNYVFFYGNDQLTDRIERIEKLLAVTLTIDHLIKPSLIDELLHTLNPKHNLNLTSHIYKISSE